MFTNQTFNQLIIDSPDRLPFPPEIKEDLKTVNWGDFTWHAFGLPALQSIFSLNGEQLYLDRDENDKARVQKQDFTGQVIISGVVNPTKGEGIYFLTFELVFCKGIICDASLREFRTQPRAEYELGFNRYCTTVERESNFKKSWFFKWIYWPYAKVVIGLTLGVVTVIQFFLKMLVWCAEKITPVKI